MVGYDCTVSILYLYATDDTDVTLPMSEALSPFMSGPWVSLLLLSLVSKRDMVGRGRSLSC